MSDKQKYCPIGVFDSGIGGLTVLSEIKKKLPQYDYVYLGDNARTPYGNRSYEVVYEFTLQAVNKLFAMGCELIILACNTASAKALRTIQQKDLQQKSPNKRVLGVLRPSTEIIGNYSKTGYVGIMGTSGTVQSNSYSIEIKRFFPNIKVTQESCPILVPLIENNLHNTEPGKELLKMHVDSLLRKQPAIDTILLACTHYPLVQQAVQKMVPSNVQVLSQGEIVALSLAEYLTRHADLEQKVSTGGETEYYTTETPIVFESKAGIFLKEEIEAKQLTV